jgi:hypothetical protein
MWAASRDTGAKAGSTGTRIPQRLDSSGHTEDAIRHGHLSQQRLPQPADAAALPQAQRWNARSRSAAALVGIKNCPELQRDASRLSASNPRYEERRRSCTRRDVGQAISLHAPACGTSPPRAALWETATAVPSRSAANELPCTLLDCWISPQRALSGGFRTRATQRNLSGTRRRRHKAELCSSCVAANSPAKAASVQPTQRLR